MDVTTRRRFALGLTALGSGATVYESPRVRAALGGFLMEGLLDNQATMRLGYSGAVAVVPGIVSNGGAEPTRESAFRKGSQGAASRLAPEFVDVSQRSVEDVAFSLGKRDNLAGAVISLDDLPAIRSLVDARAVLVAGKSLPGGRLIGNREILGLDDLKSGKILVNPCDIHRFERYVRAITGKDLPGRVVPTSSALRTFCETSGKHAIFAYGAEASIALMQSGSHSLTYQPESRQNIDLLIVRKDVIDRRYDEVRLLVEIWLAEAKNYRKGLKAAAEFLHSHVPPYTELEPDRIEALLGKTEFGSLELNRTLLAEFQTVYNAANDEWKDNYQGQIYDEAPASAADFRFVLDRLQRSEPMNHLAAPSKPILRSVQRNACAS